MPVPNMDTLQRSFIWDSPCSICGQPAVRLQRGIYRCRACVREGREAP